MLPEQSKTSQDSRKTSYWIPEESLLDFAVQAAVE
jgi:hypothetical protein